MLKSRRWRVGLIVLFVLALTLQPLAPALAATPPPSSATNISGLVRTFQRSAAGAAQRGAALQIFRNYDAYKALVAAGKVDPAAARAVDEVLVTMTQEAWRDVAVRQRAGLDYVVPVGTLGDRWSNKNYIPGKSDKDFIPRGPNASQAATDFAATFEKKFGIKPGAVDVNALDPTNISSWPDRVAAATNFEKYNTRGGTIWLENELHKSKPNLWKYDNLADGIVERRFTQIVQSTPPPMTAAEAMGFFSDNTKFRTRLAADYAGDPALAAFKQSKYDLRNLTAFELAGGALTDSDKQLRGVMDLLREGKRAEALSQIQSLTGLADPNAAMRAYLEATDALTQRMGQHVLDRHVALVADALSSGKPYHGLANELAASLANLPPGQAGAAQEAILATLGKTEGAEVVRMAETFRRRVSFANDFFDNQALAAFGKKYDQLSDAQRAILHGADDAAEGFRMSAGTALGVLLSGWAVYNAYVEGSSHGTGVALASGMSRAMVELLQAGVPITALAELAAHLVAGGVQLGAAAYKNDVLDTLYKQYQKDGDLDFLLNIQGVLPYYAGGLRQLAIDLRMQNPNASEEEIRNQIRDYFVRRAEQERVAKEMTELMQRLVAWETSRGLGLFSTDFLDKFTAQDNMNMANLLAAYNELAARLAADGIKADEQTLKNLLWHLFHPGGSQASFEAALRDVYQRYGKQYPPGGPKACHNRPVIKKSRGTTLNRKDPLGQPGPLFDVQASFTEKINGPCDPAPVVAPIELATGGHISVTLTGGAVPCVWSLWNSGGGVSVSHAPKWGASYGPAQSILGASLSCENPDAETDTRVSVEGDVPGPGRLYVSFAAPGGSGPLTGGCFANSYASHGQLVSVSAGAPNPDGSALRDGDEVQVGDNGTSIITVPGFGSIRIRGGSRVGYQAPAAGEDDKACTPGPQTFTVKNGGLRAQGGGKNDPVVIRAGDRTIRPHGTDFEMEQNETGGRVVVIEGTVEVTSDQGETVVVEAGQQYTWPDGQLTTADLDSLPPATEGDLPLAAWPLDDDTPAPYGESIASFAGGLPSDWIWQDPGDDVQVAYPDAETLELTIPDGNDLWDRRDSAPRLLHKVTGDFDLEGEITVGPDGANLVTAEFLLYAPGSYTGVLAAQMAMDSPGQHFRLLSGRGLGNYGDRLGLLGCSNDRCPAATAGTPVRLKLTRRDDLWRVYWSMDGVAWTLAQREEIILPDTLWAGWSMKRMAYDGHPDVLGQVTLRDISLSTAPRGMMPPSWDLVALPGQATVDADGRVRLALDGSAYGSLRAIQSEPLTGDFDVVVHVQPEAWEALAGASHNYGLGISTLTGSQQAYLNFGDMPSWIGRGYVADQGGEGGWTGLVNAKTSLDSEATWLRLMRRGGQLDGYAWSDCRWLSIHHYPRLVDAPVYLELNASNAWDAGVISPLTVDFTVEQVALGPDLPSLDWTPPDCSILQPATDTPAPQVPDGTTATVLAAPYPLGRVFTGPKGGIYVFASHLEKRLLLRVDGHGSWRVAVQSDALASLNNKAGVVMPDGGIAVTVDYWPEGGNPLGGIMTLAADGTYTPWTLTRGHGGITDIITAPDGYWFSDFEDDNVWFAPGAGGEEVSLLDPANTLPGLGDLAYDAAQDILYALNWAGDWPMGGEAMIVRILGDGSYAPVARPETGNFGGIVVSPGGVFPAGLYASEILSGRIVRVEEDGSLTPVVAGLTEPRDLIFSPRTGALTVVCGNGVVVRVK